MSVQKKEIKTWMTWSNFLKFIEIALLVIILVFVILIWRKPAPENYIDNCFGMQYYGEPLMNNKNAPICSKDTTNPLYPEGGCAVYDGEKVSKNYQEGMYTPAV
jgi:hypothetical protein